MKALPILLVLLMLWSAIWRPGPGTMWPGSWSWSSHGPDNGHL